MTLLRSGASKQYSDNWSAAFGKSNGKKKKAASPKVIASKSKAKSKKKAATK